MDRDLADLTLEDDVLLLRPIALEDVAVYLERQDAEMAARFEWAGPAQERDVRAAVERWVASWACHGPEQNFAITCRRTGEMVGDCELELREDGFVNVMYVVFSGWRAQRVGTRAVRLLVQHAAHAFPGRPLLFRMHPDNEGSIRVARAAGATRAGSELSRSGHVLDRWVLAPGT